MPSLDVSMRTGFCRLERPASDYQACGARAQLGVRIRGALGDIDPLNKVPFKRATKRVGKGPL